MFDQMKTFMAVMKQLPELREKAQQLQAELERKTVEGEAGGGAVRVTLNGKGRCVRVRFDAPLMLGIAGEDKAIVEELTAAAVNQAVEKVQQLIAEHVREATGGLDLPGLGGLLGSGH